MDPAIPANDRSTDRQTDLLGEHVTDFSRCAHRKRRVGHDTDPWLILKLVIFQRDSGTRCTGTVTIPLKLDGKLENSSGTVN